MLTVSTLQAASRVPVITDTPETDLPAPINLSAFKLSQFELFISSG